MFDNSDGDEYGVPIHIIEKNDNQQIRICLNEYKNHTYIDIRTFCCYGDDGDFKPTRKGVTLPPDLYPELYQGILMLGEVLGITPGDEDDKM